MGRRMILWQQPKYSDALDTHLDRHEAIAELRRAFGWRWKKAIPAGLAYRLSVGVRLEESVVEVRALLADHYAHEHAEREHIVELMNEHTPAALPARDVTEWREPVLVPTSERKHASMTLAAQARRTHGEQTRARIAAHLDEHPEHDAEQIAAVIGRHATTVRRHLAAMRGA